MEKLPMCRVCLIKDVRMHCLIKTNLQKIYELLTGNLLETKGKRPIHACYMCCARLRNCLRLRTACLHSEELFTHLLESNCCEVKPSQDMDMLHTVPVIDRNMDPVVHSELKLIHLPPMTDEQLNEEHVGDLQDNIIHQSSQYIKKENVKSEIECSEDDGLDYSIQSMKAQSNSASDNSCLGEDAQESYVSNHSISPHNINYTENVQIMEPNIYEEYKHLVPMSNESRCSPNNDSFNHIYTHSGETIYKCCICEKSYSEKRSLKLHIHHAHSDEKPFKCDRCGRSFSQKSHIRVHIRTHTEEKPFCCTTCDKKFKTKSNLKKHSRTHTGEKPYKCNICAKCFSNNRSLSEHIRIHTGEKPHKCVLCGKCFNQKKALTIHIRSHTGDKPYQCTICNKCFSTSGTLRVHNRLHTGEKPYNCNICGICFRHKGSLSSHIRTHTGERPRPCGKCFNRKDSL